MAWYRCGGGGVPASLKNDMNVVLNKKFHSLDDYDPKEWPELTNLLGKLPEATVSGSIVTFSDGADDVPLKSCEVTFPASLDGYSSATVHHTDGQTPPVFSEDYTASLGRTIYGGSADIVNGTGTDGYIKYVIDGVNNYAVNISGTNFNIMPYGLNIDGTINKWLCDAITASSTNFGYNSNQGFIFIRQAGWSSLSGVTDVASFNAYCQEHPITLMLPLATPTDFTFEPVEINTRLGNNTMWSEQGDIEVTYRRDIDLALGGQ